MVEQLSQPEDPETIARRAGKDIYGTSVGSLRRVELYRLGNAWGAKFPIGATKDHMLKFFINLEAEGRDPFRPPSLVPPKAVHSNVSHVDDSQHREVLGVDLVVAPNKPPEFHATKSDFQLKLEALPYHKLKQWCKEHGIKTSNTDKKPVLIAKIMELNEKVSQSEHNVPDGS